MIKENEYIDDVLIQEETQLKPIAEVIHEKDDFEENLKEEIKDNLKDDLQPNLEQPENKTTEEQKDIEQSNQSKTKNYYEELDHLSRHKQNTKQENHHSKIVKMNIRKMKKETNENEEETIFEKEKIKQNKRHFDLEQKMDLVLKVKKYRPEKIGEDDIEKMQDEKLDQLKNEMINCANIDIEKNARGEIATEKLKLLNKVKTLLSRADLINSILDNNLLEAVRLWLEPLPDASMPAYQIQKELINCLHNIPVKSDHLVSSGLGLIMKFYQASKRTEPGLKKSIDKLVNNWTKLILKKSDSYKDKKFHFQDYNKNDYSNLVLLNSSNKQESKSLYEESADRRKRAAIPTAKITTYSIAPKTNASLILSQQNKNNDERFKKLNQKLALMSTKKIK